MRKRLDLSVDKGKIRDYIVRMGKRISSKGRPVAVGYVRVSSGKAAKEGNSLQNQREAIVRACVLGGYDLLSVYEDGGLSGGKGEDERPGLKAALDAIREGRASVLIVKAVDRLARGTDETGHIKVEVRRAGGRVEVLDEAKADPVREAVNTMLAELERLRGSERMRFSHASRKARGQYVGVKAPFGYRIGDGRKLEEVPEEQAVVAKVLDLSRAGLSLRAVAAALDAEGIKAPTGGTWNAMTVSKILSRSK